MPMLEHLFRIFNQEHPAGFASYSLSVGDMVGLDGVFYACDPTGWRKIIVKWEE